MSEEVRSPEVVCVGILVADVIAHPVREMPKRGQLALVDEMVTHVGGCAANTGIGLSRLGVPTGVAGKAGDDAFGDFVEKTLEKNGVDTRALVRDTQTKTSGTMVMVSEDGERSFIHYMGANAELTYEDLDIDYILQARLLHVAGTFVMTKFDGEPTSRLLKLARERGVITCLDTVFDAQGRWMSILKDSLPHLDYFVPSLEEAKRIANREEPEEVAQVLIDHGVKTVGLKMGDEGCYLRSGNESVRLPALKVDAVDATGAGDAFAAGFLTGVVKGWDLEKTRRFANAVGACCVQAVGTTAGLKSFEETMKMMEH